MVMYSVKNNLGYTIHHNALKYVPAKSSALNSSGNVMICNQ